VIEGGAALRFFNGMAELSPGSADSNPSPPEQHGDGWESRARKAEQAGAESRLAETGPAWPPAADRDPRDSGIRGHPGGRLRRARASSAPSIRCAAGCPAFSAGPGDFRRSSPKTSTRDVKPAARASHPEQ
jgi:hypothetical protein